MQKIILIFISLLLHSCLGLSEREQRILNSYLNESDSDKTINTDLEDDRLSWVLIYQSPWEYNKKRNSWSRDQDFYNLEYHVISSTGIGIGGTTREKNKSYYLQNSSNKNVIYI